MSVKTHARTSHKKSGAALVAVLVTLLLSILSPLVAQAAPPSLILNPDTVTGASGTVGVSLSGTTSGVNYWVSICKLGGPGAPPCSDAAPYIIMGNGGTTPVENVPVTKSWTNVHSPYQIVDCGVGACSIVVTDPHGAGGSPATHDHKTVYFN